MSNDGGAPSSCNLKLVNKIPSDLHSAWWALHIEPDTIEYAMCSKCSTIYPPKKSGNILEWPMDCTSWHFWDSPICGQLLVKSGVEWGESIQVPIHPFVVQDFNSFTSQLLYRPGYERMLDQGTFLLKQLGELWDMKDDTAIHNLKGPDGKTFLDGFKHSELVPIFILSHNSH